jgi:hypothetical protein
MQRTSVLAALAVAGLSLSLASAGCKKAPPPAPPLASAEPVTAAPTLPPSAAVSAAPTGKMANCPTLVEGGATVIKDVEGGVELTIAAKDEAATKEIRARARHLAEVSREESPSTRHNGSGRGGGQLGRCPVVARNTVVTADDVEGGARVTVKPKDPAELDWLRREARERQSKLAR